MGLPEGVVVAISRGLRFIGQKLDPRLYLQQMSEVPPRESFDLGQGNGRDPFSEGKRSDLADEIKKAIEGRTREAGGES